MYLELLTKNIYVQDMSKICPRYEQEEETK